MAKDGRKSDPAQLFKVLAILGFALIITLLFWICFKGWVQGTYSNPSRKAFSVSDEVKASQKAAVASPGTEKKEPEKETEQKIFDEWLARRMLWFLVLIAYQLPLALAIVLKTGSFGGKKVGDEAEEISRGMVR